MTFRRVNHGFNINLSNEVVGVEPISIEEVKEYMNITFDAHDNKLQRLISACRECFEKQKTVTLISNRGVALSWLTFYDSEPLPYAKIIQDESNAVTVQYLDGTTVDSDLYQLVNTEGFVIFKGEFPDGVKLSYLSATIEITDRIKEGLIRAVADSFEKDLTPYQATLKHLRYA